MHEVWHGLWTQGTRKVRKLAWVAGERKTEEEEELYAEEEKGRFWG